MPFIPRTGTGTGTGTGNATATGTRSRARIVAICVGMLALATLSDTAHAQRLLAQHKLGTPGVTPQGIDMRILAPQRPNGWNDAAPFAQALAVPQSGSDLNSVSQDWMTRQAHLLTGGAEERLLADLNEKMNRQVTRLLLASDTTVPAAPVDPKDDPANSSDDLAFLRPTSVRFAQINRFEMDWTDALRFQWSAVGNTMQFDLSAPLGGNSSVGLRHDTLRSLDSIHLQFSW